MSNIEKKVLSLLENHLTEMVFIGVFLLGFLIRYYFRSWVSGDANAFLLQWYEVIREGGGIASLRNQVGDYNILYQTLIALFTYLPIKPLYDYKILSCIFDIILSLTVGLISYEFSDKNKKWFLFGYTLTFLSPLVILNSSCWAQCDSIYTSFVILSLYFLFKKKYFQSFVFLGLAFSFKLQAVFILPFFLYVYFDKKEFSIFNFLIVFVVMIIAGLPGIVQGRSITDVFTIYLNQTSSYKYVTLGYPSFLNLIIGFTEGDLYELLKMPAIITTISALLLFFYYIFIRKYKLDWKNFINAAFISSYICVLFLPAMHQRYGSIYEILAIIVLVMNRRTLCLYFPLVFISLETYVNYLFGANISLYFLSILNVILFIAYFKMLFIDKKATIQV